jgi:hypothetical protein
MAFAIKSTLAPGDLSSPWAQITDADIRVRVFAGEVIVEVADDALGTKKTAVSNEAPNSATGSFRAPVREYLSAETGAWYRLSSAGEASADLSSGGM